MSRSAAPTAVDLFSGAGGLTLGLKRAGFRVVAAVEVNPEIAKTYRANHPSVKLIVKDIRKVTGEEILRKSRIDHVTLVAGCPPCQGFSKLTDKYTKDDPRNKLIAEMARIVQELKPGMVMMENVAGLANRGKKRLNKFVRALESMGYVVNHGVVQLADYGIPQSRRRLVLLAGLGFQVPFPRKTHSYKADARHGLEQWMNLRDAIGRVQRRPLKLSEAMRSGGPQKARWHVVRDLKEITKSRLRALSTGENRKSLPTALRPDCHVDTDDGFENVYGRLRWDRTPPTITAGCTTACKGRFGHPSQLRTISVREAALIQTFPMSYKFNTDFMETACDLVGNALPPKFAEQVAVCCFESSRDQVG